MTRQRASFAPRITSAYAGVLSPKLFLDELYTKHNRDNTQIERETVKKTYKAKEQAQRQLEEERRQQREQRERGDHSL